MSAPASRGLTSPSLENITTNLNNLATPFSPSVGSSTTTPISPEHINTGTWSLAKTAAPLLRPRTYLIVGASRGIGLEFTKQLLQRGHQVIAVVRDPSTASQLWQVTGSLNLRPGSCILEQCDVASSSDIEQFVTRMKLHVLKGGSIDTVILNAGILDYDQGLGALNVEFEMLERHLRVNCVGNIVLARKILMLNDQDSLQQRRELQQVSDPTEERLTVARQVIFMSSDSGSMTKFTGDYEDGFAAYSASKAALNMTLRHMAAELKRRGEKKIEDQKHDWQSHGGHSMKPWEHDVCVLAMHPGEVSTDMANIELGWEVEGIISPQESVSDMLKVLEDKDSRHTGTFWRWDGTEHPW